MTDIEPTFAPEQLQAAARQFVMQCGGCGAAGCPQLMPLPAIVYVRAFIELHRDCKRLARR